MKRKFKSRLIGAFIALLFFVIGTLTLPDYNINWDSINHLLRGQAYLHYFLTGKKTFDDLPKFTKYYQKDNTLLFVPNTDNVSRRSCYQIAGYDFQRYSQQGFGHPPLSDILSSFSNHLFFQKLGLINDVDAYHLYGIILGSLLIFVLFVWVAENYSFLTALVSCLSLILYPLFFGEVHFNTEKDIPETIFYAFTIISFYRGVTKNKWRWIILSSFFFGLAWGTKFNILFAPLVILPWLVVYHWKKIKSFKWPFDKKITLSFILYPVLPIVIFFASWPFLWADPFVRFKEIIDYYLMMGLSPSFDSRYLTFLGINTYASQWILYTTPLVILFFSFLGIVYALKNTWSEKNKNTFLVFLWFLIPILRVSIPGKSIYGGVRQIMEYIPPMAILSGIGAHWLRGGVIKLVKSRLLVSFLFILAFLPITIKLISIHPNQNVYFNPLIGGLKGAKEKNFMAWGDSFGNPYRQAATWLNQHAEKDAKLVFAFEMLSNLPPMFLRSDIKLNNHFRSGFWKQGEYAFGLTYQGAMEPYFYTRYLDKIIEPVYEVKVDGISILKVWKNDQEHTREEYRKEDEVTGLKFEVDEDSITVNLNKVSRLSRIEINYERRNCKPIKQGIISFSADGETWQNVPGELPAIRLFATIGAQDKGEKWVWAFTGQEIQFVKIMLSPQNACLKRVKSIKAWEFK